MLILLHWSWSHSLSAPPLNRVRLISDSNGDDDYDDDGDSDYDDDDGNDANIGDMSILMPGGDGDHDDDDDVLVDANVGGRCL